MDDISERRPTTIQNSGRCKDDIIHSLSLSCPRSGASALFIVVAPGKKMRVSLPNSRPLRLCKIPRPVKKVE